MWASMPRSRSASTTRRARFSSTRPKLAGPRDCKILFGPMVQRLGPLAGDPSAGDPLAGDPLTSAPPAFGDEDARQILRDGFGVDGLPHPAGRRAGPELPGGRRRRAAVPFQDLQSGGHPAGPGHADGRAAPHRAGRSWPAGDAGDPLRHAGTRGRRCPGRTAGPTRCGCSRSCPGRPCQRRRSAPGRSGPSGRPRPAWAGRCGAFSTLRRTTRSSGTSPACPRCAHCSAMSPIARAGHRWHGSWTGSRPRSPRCCPACGPR